MVLSNYISFTKNIFLVLQKDLKRHKKRKFKFITYITYHSKGFQKMGEEKTIRVRLDIKENEPHHEMFNRVKQERGVTINNELIRILIKEEYDRIKAKTPYPIDDELYIAIENEIKKHPEHGYRDVEEFIRASVRAAFLSPSNASTKLNTHP